MCLCVCVCVKRYYTTLEPLSCRGPMWTFVRCIVGWNGLDWIGLDCGGHYATKQRKRPQHTCTYCIYTTSIPNPISIHPTTMNRSMGHLTTTAATTTTTTTTIPPTLNKQTNNANGVNHHTDDGHLHKHTKEHMHTNNGRLWTYNGPDPTPNPFTCTYPVNITAYWKHVHVYSSCSRPRLHLWSACALLYIHKST